jgi:hypothetical protein
MIQTVITFECCGNVVTTTGYGTGKHTEYCLACDTNDPRTSVETEEV